MTWTCVIIVPPAVRHVMCALLKQRLFQGVCDQMTRKSPSHVTSLLLILITIAVIIALLLVI